MRLFSFSFLSITLVGASAACAGDAAVPREHFKETINTPFIFRASRVSRRRRPLPLRFAAALPHCESRNPPPLSPAARGEPKIENPPLGDKAAPETSAAPVYPAPVEPPPKPDAADFSKVPDEVLDFFKNTEGRPVRRAYLFDPIFQPVQPDELPKSKVQSQKK